MPMSNANRTGVCSNVLPFSLSSPGFFPIQVASGSEWCSADTCQSLVVAVEAPCPGHLGLPIHPDLPDDALALLQALGPLQLLCRGEDILVQSPLEASVSPHRDVRCCVRTAILTVAAVAAAGPILLELPPAVVPPAVCLARDFRHQGCQGEDQSDAYTRDKVQSNSFRVFWKRKKRTF